MLFWLRLSDRLRSLAVGCLEISGKPHASFLAQRVIISGFSKTELLVLVRRQARLASAARAPPRHEGCVRGENSVV